MKYIDKSINEIKGKSVINTLLKNCWSNSEALYFGADYDGLSKPQYRGNILKLILDEQQNLCCYCMKNIVNSSSTIEHLIPIGINKREFETYLVTHELKDNVIHKEAFDRTLNSIPPNLYPHDIAYHNLLGSCNSNIHCNNFRGNNTITPLIFDKQIANYVEYDNAGNAFSENYEDDLNTLGLTKSNSPLRFIRKIWFELSKQFDNLEDISIENIDEIMQRLFLRSNNIKDIENFSGNTTYRAEITKYQWFFHYYKSLSLADDDN
jgi:hypothetical protein